MIEASLQEIIDTIKNRGLTAYEISKELPISEVGINKILNGQSKNPRESTLILLRNYLFKEDEEIKHKETPNDRFEDLVAAKVMAQIDIKLEGVRGYHKTVINELAKNATRVQRILTRLEILEENLIQETRKLKDHFK